VVAGRKRKGGGEQQYLPAWLARYVNGQEAPDGASMLCNICGAWSRVVVYVPARTQHGVVMVPAYQCCPACAVEHAPRYAPHRDVDLARGVLRDATEPACITIDWTNWGRTATAPARCDGVPSHAAVCQCDADATGLTAPAHTEVR
jgi:hypothetical protein